MGRGIVRTIPYSKQNLRSQLPELPPEKWCDFRAKYEKGKTLKAIAEKFHCDPRTVKHCLLLNRGSGELGRQNAPKKAESYLRRIDELYRNYLFKNTETVVRLSHNTNYAGICQISRLITEEITKEGYAGSERTVRNYLRSRFYVLKSSAQE